MNAIKDQILKELTQLIEHMDEYADDVSEKMWSMDDSSSNRWCYQSGKFSGMSDAVMMTIMTKFTIRKLLEKLPD